MTIPSRSVTSYNGTSLNTFSGAQPRIVAQLVRGLDDSWDVRGKDTVIPGAAGRTARSRVRDNKKIELELWVFGLGTSNAAQTDDFRDAMETLRSLFDPTAAAATLIVALEDGVRSASISCRTINMIVAEYIGPVGAQLNVELEAIGNDWSIS